MSGPFSLGRREPSLPGAAEARALVKRARQEARRWMFRSVMLALVSGLALARHWLIFGLVFLALTVMAAELSRSTRRRARDLDEKLRGQEPK
jgi:uncharacterized membrane protein YciS (DUF1049 family)